MKRSIVDKIVGGGLILVAFYSYFYEAKTPPLVTTILLALSGIYLIIMSGGDGQGRFAKTLRVTIIVLSVLVVIKTFFFG